MGQIDRWGNPIKPPPTTGTLPPPPGAPKTIAAGGAGTYVPSNNFGLTPTTNTGAGQGLRTVPQGNLPPGLGVNGKQNPLYTGGANVGPSGGPSGNPTSSTGLYNSYQTAWDSAQQMGDQNLSTIAGESGNIQQGYQSAQQQATYQQDLMARKAAAMSAMMGGSAGGGAAQAGSTQAALSGEQYQNQATQQMVQQKLQQSSQMVGARSAMIQNQMSIAQQMLQSATTADQTAKAQAIYLSTQQQQQVVNMLQSMIQAGTPLDAATIQQALNAVQGSSGGPNSFPTG